MSRLKSTRAEMSKAKMVAVTIGVFRRAIKVDGRGRAVAKKTGGRKGVVVRKKTVVDNLSEPPQ